jgi:hypothetical protein
MKIVVWQDGKIARSILSRHSYRFALIPLGCPEDPRNSVLVFETPGTWVYIEDCNLSKRSGFY